MNLTATINIRFRLKHDAVPQLHQTIGPDYVTRMLRPEIGNRAREIIAEYTAEEIYSTKRQEVQKKIRTHTEAMLGQSMIQRTEQESEYGEHYRDIARRDADHLRHADARPGAAAAVNAAINRKIEQYYLVQEYALPRRAREEGIRAQADRGERHPRLPADGDAGHLRFLRALARHRGDASARAIAQHQDRDHRQRQGRPAGHPRQCRHADAPQKPAAVPDNSEAARQRPAGATPPILEKTPASNLPTPPERPSPTGVPRAPGNRPPPEAPPNPDAAPPSPGAAPPPPGKQSGTSPLRGGAISASDVRNFISRLVWQDTQSSPSTPQAPGPISRPAPGDSPRYPPEAGAPPHPPEPPLAQHRPARPSDHSHP